MWNYLFLSNKGSNVVIKTKKLLKFFEYFLILQQVVFYKTISKIFFGQNIVLMKNW